MGHDIIDNRTRESPTATTATRAWASKSGCSTTVWKSAAPASWRNRSPWSNEGL